MFNVTSGRNYIFSYCSADGATCSYNSALTLRKTDNSFLAYNDDGGCGDDAKITWTATFTGTVKLITSISGCGTNTTSSTLRYMYTGAKEAEGNVDEIVPEYQVYPNPSMGVIYVEATSGFENVKQIAVFNVTGKLVKKIDLSTKPDNIYGIDLSGQKPGYYLVKLIGGTEQRFKVLLNK